MTDNLFITTRELAADVASRAALATDLLLERDVLLAEIERLQDNLHKATATLRANDWRSRIIREALAELETNQ